MGNNNISPAVSPEVQRSHQTNPQPNTNNTNNTNILNSNVNNNNQNNAQPVDSGTTNEDLGEYEEYEIIPIIAQLSPAKTELLDKKLAALKEFDSKTNNSKKIDDYFDPVKLSQQLFNFNKDATEIRLAVKIFLSSATPGLATNVAKLLKPMNKNIIFGATHAGLQVGNVVIDWNQSGLVHIGELKSAKAAVLFDVHDAVRVNYTEDLERKIISFIQKWNTSYEYSPAVYNCHRFVSEFLQQTLGLSLMRCFEGPLGKYIQYVRAHGDSTPRLFSKHYGEIVFNSHEELEKVEKERKEDPNLIESERKWHKLTKEEINLMKVFHRGFQLQEAAEGKDMSKCCHGLPTAVLEICNDEKVNFDDNVFYNGGI